MQTESLITMPEVVPHLTQSSSTDTMTMNDFKTQCNIEPLVYVDKD